MDHISLGTDNHFVWAPTANTARFKGFVKVVKALGTVCSIMVSGMLLQSLYRHLLPNQGHAEQQAVFNVKKLAVQGKCHEAIQSLTSVLTLATRNTALLDIGTAEQCDLQMRLAAFQGIDDDGTIGEIATTNLIRLHIHRKNWAEALTVIQTKVNGATNKDKHIKSIYSEMSVEIVALCRKSEFTAANQLIETVSADEQLAASLQDLVRKSIPADTITTVRQSAESLMETPTNVFNDPNVLKQLVDAKLDKGIAHVTEAINIVEKASGSTRDNLLGMIAIRCMDVGFDGNPSFESAEEAINKIQDGITKSIAMHRYRFRRYAPLLTEFRTLLSTKTEEVINSAISVGNNLYSKGFTDAMIVSIIDQTLSNDHEDQMYLIDMAYVVSRIIQDSTKRDLCLAKLIALAFDRAHSYDIAVISGHLNNILLAEFSLGHSIKIFGREGWNEERYIRWLEKELRDATRSKRVLDYLNDPSWIPPPDDINIEEVTDPAYRVIYKKVLRWKAAAEKRGVT